MTTIAYDLSRLIVTADSNSNENATAIHRSPMSTLVVTGSVTGLGDRDYTKRVGSPNSSTLDSWLYSLPQSFEELVFRIGCDETETIRRRIRYMRSRLSDFDNAMNGKCIEESGSSRCNEILTRSGSQGSYPTDEHESEEDSTGRSSTSLSDDEESSVQSISDLRGAFDEKIKPILDRDPELAGRLIHSIVPRLHYVGPLFKGDGLLSLIDGEASSDGGTKQASNSGSSPLPRATTSGSSSTTKTKGSSKKRSRDQDKDGEQRRRGGKDSGVPSGPSEIVLVWRRLKCVYYAENPITQCFKDGRPSNDSGFSNCHHMQPHLKEYHTIVWCQKCHLRFLGPDAISCKNNHQRECYAQALPPSMGVIDCDVQAKLDENLRRTKSRNWQLENESDDMQQWVSTYIRPFIGISNVNSRSDFSDLEGTRLRTGQRELAKWYIHWTTLFSGPPPDPLYDRNVSSSLRYKQRLVELFGYVMDSMAEPRLVPPSIVAGTKVFSQECLAVLLELVGTLPSSTTAPGSISAEQIASIVREMIPAPVSDISTIQGSAEVQKEYHLTLPEGHMLVESPRDRDPLLCALDALRHSIFHQYPNLPTPTTEHLCYLAGKENVVEAVRDARLPVDESSSVIAHIAGVLQEYGKDHGWNLQLAVHRDGEPSSVPQEVGSQTLWIHHGGLQYTAMQRAPMATTAATPPRSLSQDVSEMNKLTTEQPQDLPPETTSLSQQQAGTHSIMADLPRPSNDDVTTPPTPSSPTNSGHDSIFAPEASYYTSPCEDCGGIGYKLGDWTPCSSCMSYMPGFQQSNDGHNHDI